MLQGARSASLVGRGFWRGFDGWAWAYRAAPACSVLGQHCVVKPQTSLSLQWQGGGSSGVWMKAECGPAKKSSDEECCWAGVCHGGAPGDGLYHSLSCSMQESLGEELLLSSLSRSIVGSSFACGCGWLRMRMGRGAALRSRVAIQFA